MLSKEMITELAYVTAMVVYGFGTAIGYQVLLYIRVIWRHTVPFLDAEDILFFAAAGIGFFLIAYRMNDGILRWYAFAGCFVGVVLHEKTLGRMSKRARKWLLQKLRKTYKIKGV